MKNPVTIIVYKIVNYINGDRNKIENVVGGQGTPSPIVIGIAFLIVVLLFVIAITNVATAFGIPRLRQTGINAVVNGVIEHSPDYSFSLEVDEVMLSVLSFTSILELLAVEAKATEIRALANQGDAVAQLVIGWMYLQGVGVPQDDFRSTEWVRKAADQGLARAQNSLGIAYLQSIGVPQDYDEALKWILLAVDQGNAHAMNSLGLSLEHGRGVPQNSYQAVQWLRIAAEKGNNEAQFSLGWMYDNGRGIPQDIVQAIRWYTLAAEQGNWQAAQRLNEISSE